MKHTIRKHIIGFFLSLCMIASFTVSLCAVDLYSQGKIIGTKSGEIEFITNGESLATGILAENGTSYVYQDFLWEFDYTPLTVEGNKEIFSFLINPDNPSEGYSLVLGDGKASLCKKGDLSNPIVSKDVEWETKCAYTVKIAFAEGTLSVYVYEAFQSSPSEVLLSASITDRTEGGFEVSSEGGHFRLDNFTVTNMGTGAALDTEIVCTEVAQMGGIITPDDGGIHFNASPDGSDCYLATSLFADAEGNTILAKNFVFEFDYVPQLTEWQRDRIAFLQEEDTEAANFDDCYVVWCQGNATGAPTFSGYRNNYFDNMLGYAAATYYMNVPCRIRIIVTGNTATVYMADPDFAVFDEAGFTMELADRTEDGGFSVMTYAGEFALNNMMIFTLAGETVETFGIEAAYVKDTETTPEESDSSDVTTKPSDDKDTTDESRESMSDDSGKPAETTSSAEDDGGNMGLTIGIIVAAVVVVAVVVLIVIKKKK